MADGKNIELKIAATGGDQAAAEVRKPVGAVKDQTAAVKELTAAEKDYQDRKAAFEARRASGAFDKNPSGSGEVGGMGGMLDYPAAGKLEELSSRVEVLKEEAKAIAAIGEASEEAGDKSGKLDENIERIARTQKAQAVADFGAKIADIGRGFQDAAEEVEEFDRATAQTLRNTGNRLNQLGGSLSVVAAGFAVGGPIGAAAASLGVFVKSVVDRIMGEWANAARELDAAKSKLRDIQQAERDAKTAADDRSTAIGASTITTALDKELGYHKQITEEWRRQIQLKRELRRLDDEVLNEQDQRDLAGIDYDEAAGKLTSLQAADKRAEIESAARKRDRDERKRQAFEDAQEAAANAINAQKVADDAKKGADDLGGKSTIAQSQAEEARNKATAELSKMKPDKNGEFSDADRKRAADLEAELERANNRQKALAKAAQDAQEEAAQRAREAAQAIRDAKDKGTIADRTSTALESAQGLDDERTQTASRTRVREGLNETRKSAAEKKAESDKKAAAEARKREADDDRRRSAGRDLETDITDIGKDAAKATRGIGAKGINPEGFNTLAAKIAKKGTPEQDKVDLSSFLSKIGQLVDNIPDSKSKSVDAQALREVERKLEKKIEALTQRTRGPK